MEVRWTGHETRPGCRRANSVYRPYGTCNASATLLSQTVTERAPRLTCQCPTADLAGNQPIDQRDTDRSQHGLRRTQTDSVRVTTQFTAQFIARITARPRGARAGQLAAQAE